MFSRASATVAALGTAALAATALVSVSSPASGAATVQQWRCEGSPGYAASISTGIYAVRNDRRLEVEVSAYTSDGSTAKPTGTVEGATTQYTGPTVYDPSASLSTPTALAKASLTLSRYQESTSRATLTFTNANEDKFVGYIPTGNFCASGTYFAQ